MKTTKLGFAVAAALVAISAAGCGDDEAGDDDDDVGQVDAGDDIDAPAGACQLTAWTAPDFTTNAADALALRAQLDMLTGTTMRGAEQETVIVDEVSDLEAIYDGGSPALSASVPAGFDAIIDGAFAGFVAVALAGPQDLVDDGGNWTPGDDGGIFGARQAGINTGGLELRQIVDKGLFGGGGLYAYALGLTEGNITADTIDALAAAWGTDAALDPEARTDSANYAYRMGFHGGIAQALTAAKAYTADDACTAERDEALETFFEQWELALIARTVYYANASATAMAAATTDDERADALHELAEGLGLALGFYGLPDPSAGPMAGVGRVITDADVEAMMTALGVDIDDFGASTTGAFVSDSAGFQTGVTALETRVKQVYQLDDADIASYRTPTDG